MNNNNYKWETVGNAKFYTDGTTCTDIEVMDNAKTVSFIYPKFKIDRETCQKVFSSVENLIIEKISRRILVTSVVMQRACARLHQTRTGFLIPLYASNYPQADEQASLTAVFRPSMS